MMGCAGQKINSIHQRQPLLTLRPCHCTIAIRRHRHDVGLRVVTPTSLPGGLVSLM